MGSALAIGDDVSAAGLARLEADGRITCRRRW
jgi:hypothetical protein